MSATPIDRLIKIEKEGQKRYSEMMKESPLSNIRYFLKSFSEARGRLAMRLQFLREGKSIGPSVSFSKIIDIHATEHLLNNEVPDLSSLSSTLLFITTQEKEVYNLYLQTIDEVPDGVIRDSLRLLASEREQIKIKADRLYNDLVQTSY